MQKWHFELQGCHIWAVFKITYMLATLKIKIVSGFKLRTFKTFKIWKLTFRVPKKCMSGLPYLQMGWGKVFKNICFYNQENPKSVTQQSVLTETAFRLESSSRNMCVAIVQSLKCFIQVHCHAGAKEESPGRYQVDF